MAGKVAVVTGATSGIGRTTVKGLAGLCASLVLVGRNEEKLSVVGEEIAESSGQRPVLMRADLSSMGEVRQLAGRIREELPKIDVLINNAGTIVGRRRLTPEGLEYTFALDHLSPFLLTNLLLERMMFSAPSRIITVSSAAHFFGRMHFDDLMLERGYTSFKAYSQAKLANVLFTYELARRLEGTGVTANCLNPGGVRTRFGNEASGLTRIGLVAARPFELSPDQGARTSIYLASSPDVEGATGLYFSRREPRRSSPASYDRDSARRLWEVSASLTRLDRDRENGDYNRCR